MPDLTTNYLGLELANPIVPSSSPLMRHIDNIKKMEDAGAAAVVLHSLFEEQIMSESQKLDFVLSYGADSFPEALSYFPDLYSYNLGPDGYLEHIRRAKAAVAIPVIASLNAFSMGSWIEFGRLMQDAGADALELNMYYLAADPEQDSSGVEGMYLDLVREIRRVVTIPLAVKVGPQFTAFAHFAGRLMKAGANGLVLFNRFYQPDIDIENLEVVPSVRLSSPEELRLRLRWIAMLYGRVDIDFAVTGGLHSGEDIIKAMMVGAKVGMTTSALLEHGIEHLRTMLTELNEWMQEHEYESISQMRGSMSHRSVSHPGAFERANYMQVLQAYEPQSLQK